jgi:hypothetical protein
MRRLDLRRLPFAPSEFYLFNQILKLFFNHDFTYLLTLFYKNSPKSKQKTQQNREKIRKTKESINFLFNLTEQKLSFGAYLCELPAAPR